MHKAIVLKKGEGELLYADNVCSSFCVARRNQHRSEIRTGS
jgi:hypothetical protein